MSETFIFIVGVLVFAMTVAGSIIAAGLALGRIQIQEDPELRAKVDDEELEKTFPIVNY